MSTTARAARRSGISLGLVAVAVVVAQLSGVSNLVRHRDSQPTFKLLSAPVAFTLAGAASGLGPGSSSSLQLTATNQMSVPITVNSITAQITGATYADGSAAPAACQTYLTPNFASSATPANSYTWSGLSLPAAANGGTTGVSEPFSFVSQSHVNQTSCEGVTFKLAYTGTALYTDTTTTQVVTSNGSSGVLAPVKLTATVTPTYSGMNPTGTVAFYNGSTLLAGTPTYSTSGTALIASLTTSALPRGSNSISAVYTPSGAHDGGPDFVTSKGTVVQNVGSCVSAAMTYTQTVSSGTYAGNISVAAGHSLLLSGGTISGNVTVASGGTFVATGGTVSGNVTSTAGAVSIQGATVRGNIVSTGSLSVGPSASVSGNVQATGGGPVCVGSSVTISGNLQITSLPSSAIPATICGTTVQGNVQLTSDAVPADIGGSSLCGGNTISGNLQVTSDSGALTVGGTSYGNTVKGNLQLTSNTGSSQSTVTANTVSGNCQLSSNKPGVVGSGNTAKGNNSCNTGSAGA